MNRRDLMKLLAAAAPCLPASAIKSDSMAGGGTRVLNMKEPPRGYFNDTGLFVRVYNRYIYLEDGKLKNALNPDYLKAPFQLEIHASLSEPKNYSIKVVPNPDLKD